MTLGRDHMIDVVETRITLRHLLKKGEEKEGWGGGNEKAEQSRSRKRRTRIKKEGGKKEGEKN